MIVVAAGLIIGSSYCWARRQGLLAAGSAAELSQRWSGLGGWCAGALAYALPRWGLGLGWP